jgi:hypothetical protein
MKPFILIITTLLFASKIYSQATDEKVSPDFIFGAWSDTIHSKTGEGFIFSPDGCLSFIIDGELTECIIENQNLKVRYRVNYNAKPRQLDFLLIDLKKDSIKEINAAIFEIIDNNHIKLANYRTISGKRPVDFTPGEDVEIVILTRYTGKQKFNNKHLAP